MTFSWCCVERGCLLVARKTERCIVVRSLGLGIMGVVVYDIWKGAGGGETSEEQYSCFNPDT